MALKKVYVIRHQAGGVLMDKVYATPPTQMDLEMVQAAQAKLHGAVFKKTGEPWWVKVQEATIDIPDGFDVSDFEDAPPPPAPAENGLGGDNAAALPKLTVSGTGTVTPPEGA